MNKTPLSYMNYHSDKMLNALEMNRYEDEIYKILFVTGKYMNAKDMFI